MNRLSASSPKNHESATHPEDQSNEATVNTIDFATLCVAQLHDVKNHLALLLAGLETPSTNQRSDPLPSLPGLTEESRQTLKLSTHLLNERLRQLLTLYRLQKDLYRLQVDFCFLPDFLEDRLAEVQPLLAARRLALTAAPIPPINAVFDMAATSLILNVALHNALQFARQKITLHAQAAGNKNGVSIIIADDGPGYPASVLEHYARTPATLLPRSTSQDKAIGHSAGLGLYIAHQLAHLHEHQQQHGTIHLAKNAVLGGAQFTLFLP